MLFQPGSFTTLFPPERKGSAAKSSLSAAGAALPLAPLVISAGWPLAPVIQSVRQEPRRPVHLVFSSFTLANGSFRGAGDERLLDQRSRGLEKKPKTHF